MIADYPDQLEIVPLPEPPACTVSVPGSKSITNRALVLAALTSHGHERSLQGVLRSEDTEVMLEALRQLGFSVHADWVTHTVRVSAPADAGITPKRAADLYVANSGTSMRFLTAMVSLGQGSYRLDGVPRMRERPIGDLLEALGQLGVKARSESSNGCPPVTIEADGLRGGDVRINGNISSQFLTGLLLSAPFAQGPTTIKVSDLVSWPYVTMTLSMLEQWGLQAGCHGAESACADFRFGAKPPREALRQACFHVAGSASLDRVPSSYAIEPDASAASYFFGAAAVCGGDVKVTGLSRASLQGDVRFVELLHQMGCLVDHEADGIRVRGRPLHGIDADMNDISDTVMTLAAVACFAKGPTTIRNVAHIRHKETDRLAALAAELRKLGVGVDELTDGLRITPAPMHGATIDTYNDHRMAMSLALVGLRINHVVINNPGCVAKTYPEFFADLERLR